ncbi:DUF4383 domain-containing protein [Nonomuraea sp. SYSU D8015]|uniref:DUF4383 domain-containing protein n=1 Tax=Nonomuraea sp. SYSU D8015 TaxID=2593644 RepID=UPI0016603B05|nr:DUF4383 domain-containing protein [Nonomuraea sp. SYSU D8015]
MDSPRTYAGGSPVQLAAFVVGALFVFVGVLGFIPGVTTHYPEMGFAGHESGALLLNVFQVSILHNLVHLLFGIAGILLSRTWSAARAFLAGGGAIYLALGIYGMVVGQDTPANFVPVNTADNWLHVVLGVGMIALAFLPARHRASATR